MSDFLLELRSEEIPARMQATARAELEKLFRAGLTAAGVTDTLQLTVWSTPRRLALIAEGLPEATAAVSEEVKGPRTTAPAQALEGFLRKTGLTADQLTERDGVWFAITQTPGRPIAEVLKTAIEDIVRKFAWPKSMRWGKPSISSESLRWVRPLQGIVALLDGQIVPAEIAGIQTGRVTYGHRFHIPETPATGFSASAAPLPPGALEINNAQSYAEALRSHHVIVDHAARAELIRNGAHAAAAAAGLRLVPDEGLVIENAGLTEWPVPLLGRFDETFLEVPPEVIQLTARVNQKYFVCEDAAGNLANAFICTANIAARDGGAGIVAGNRKVLAARLSDARHFWEEDQWNHEGFGKDRHRTTRKTLALHAEKLARITFHEKLGTVADKVARVAKLARWLAEEGIVPNADPAQAELAAQLCKADLVTEMVGEFPELQGLMGGYYARAEGLPDAVADAIRDHYKPVGQGDDVPTAPVTVCVALADKLDTLAGFFYADMKPTGSKDPFALRRAALGIIQIVLDNRLRLGLTSALVEAMSGHAVREAKRVFGEGALEIVRARNLLEGYSSDASSAANFAIADVATASAIAFSPTDLLAFFADRLKVQQREAGVRHDLIDAVFALGGEDDLVRLLARVHALQAFVATEDGTNLLAGYKRAANILRAESKTGWEPGATNPAPEPAEAALQTALAEAAPQAEQAIAAEDFAAAMSALASLRGAVDQFFNDVTVNDADANKRAARLDLLDRFRAAVHKVADFSRIEG